MNQSSRTSIKNSFRLIQVLIALLLIFLVVQGLVLWHVCQRGTQATHGLKQEGLPSIRLLASLQENLAVYRLHSFELMFAQDKDRSAKLAETDAVQQHNLELLAQLNELYPAGEGHQRVAALSAALDDYVRTMGQIRAALDKDFAGSMAILDKDVPAKVRRLNDTAEQVKDYCTTTANERTRLTVSSFDNIRYYVLWLGTTSIVGAAFTMMMIALSSSRVRFALTNVVNNLSQNSAQVNQAAGQVAHASQTLARGSSEQASSIEETSASLEEMASMTKRNAENAQKANDLAREARAAADKGAEDMKSMNQAMEEIKVSSDDIAKIIKTIDEIAFQTNILALNAAVEAARAGEAGMGFAVVADEVRSLAQRSATAAKETAAKIEGAIIKTAQGVQISHKVAAALNDIVIKARQVDELASEVAGASREQTQGITQINAAVGQMDKVTQSNAVSAEQSAGAAQQLNAEAEMMKQAVGELLQLVGSSLQTTAPVKAAPIPVKKTVRAAANSSTAANGHNGQNGHAPAAHKNGNVVESRHGEIPMEGDFRDF